MNAIAAAESIKTVISGFIVSACDSRGQTGLFDQTMCQPCNDTGQLDLKEASLLAEKFWSWTYNQ